MSLRDDLLPVVDDLRGIPGSSDFGIRRYAVTIRRRTWSGSYPGDGTPTDQDVVISPLPRVRNLFAGSSQNAQALQYQLANGTIIDDRFYRIDLITPAYVGGGYTPQQLRLRPSPDVKNVEEIVVIVGDDGLKRDCTQHIFEQDRAFHYAMTVKESDRPRAALSSITISPSSPSVVHGQSLQLKAIGTFSDRDTSDLTPLAIWSSSAPLIATIDVLGNLTGVSAGSATITASLTGISQTGTVTVT